MRKSQDFAALTSGNKAYLLESDEAQVGEISFEINLKKKGSVVMVLDILQTKSHPNIKAGKTPPLNPPDKEPTVQLSQTIKKACLALNKTAEIDANKVAAVKQAIHQGNYTVDTLETARKLLSIGSNHV